MSVQWSGLQEFRADLKNMPEHLADEAGSIVMASAQQAAQDVQGAYPQGPTGKLKRGVTARLDNRGRAGASALVKSGARHSHLFEKGTGPRKNANGANRGRMPEAPASQQMIPIVIRARRQMVLKLIQMLQAEGLTVTSS
jgi:bacteriophage HK97-gp10 putative tail-component